MLGTILLLIFLHFFPQIHLVSLSRRKLSSTFTNAFWKEKVSSVDVGVDFTTAKRVRQQIASYIELSGLADDFLRFLIFFI